jgi:hypothetical protein
MAAANDFTVCVCGIVTRRDSVRLFPAPSGLGHLYENGTQEQLADRIRSMI